MSRFHITPAIFWTFGGTLLSGLTGPIVALLIAREFSPEMQGYYYTFNSLLAMSIFLELGFNGCIVQFISHEYAHLKIENNVLTQDSARSLERLASLVLLSLKWYAAASILLLIGVGLAGEIFFRYNQSANIVHWRGPWWCLCILSAVNIMILPLSALLDGCNQVNWTARLRMAQNIGRSVVLISGLLLGLGLYAPAAATAIAIVIYVFLFNIKWKRLLDQIVNYPVLDGVSWAKEIFPMQWRIAVSWTCGYFIFSIFNPLIFAYSGPSAAGKFGMTWSILAAINSLSQAFVTTRAPRFGSLTANNEWEKLRILWKTSTLQTIGSYTAVSLLFIACVVALKIINLPLQERILTLDLILPLCIAGILNQLVFSIAIVARAEKREPFMWLSLIVATVTAGGSYLTVEAFMTSGIVYSYLAGTIIAIYYSIKILHSTSMMKFKRDDHAI